MRRFSVNAGESWQDLYFLMNIKCESLRYNCFSFCGAPVDVRFGYISLLFSHFIIKSNKQFSLNVQECNANPFQSLQRSIHNYSLFDTVCDVIQNVGCMRFWSNFVGSPRIPKHNRNIDDLPKGDTLSLSHVLDSTFEVLESRSELRTDATWRLSLVSIG